MQSFTKAARRPIWEPVLKDVGRRLCPLSASGGAPTARLQVFGSRGLALRVLADFSSASASSPH